MRLRRKWMLTVPVCLFLLVRVSCSHAAVRTWTDVTGRHSTEADFVDFKDGKVRLRKTNGTVVTVLLKTLSSVDQRYVRARGRSRAVAQIGLAMHVYHDTHGSLPKPASRDKEGRPLLSWRVHLLPYLKEEATYDKFHLDEPWDSPHNLKLIKEIPEVFRLSRENRDGKTSVMLFVGDGTAFGDGTANLGFRDIVDGMSHTMMAVEAGADKAVPWTKPEDLTYDAKNPAAALGTIPPEGFWALFFDGKIRLFAGDIDPALLKALLTHNGGEPEPVEELARLRDEETITHLIAEMGARVTTSKGTANEPEVTVDLSDCGIHLTTALHVYRDLTRPVRLKLGGSRVTDDTLEVLSITSGPHFAPLKGLDLSRTQVTDAGLEHLKGLTKLQSLDLRGTQATDEGAKKLQQALPNCKIEH